MLKTLAKYVVAPGAGLGMLAALGVFEPMTTGPAPTGALTSPEAAGARMLDSMAGPLAVAQRIAAAGAEVIGMSPDQLPAFLTGGGIPSAGAGAGVGVVPVAVRKTVSAPGDAGAVTGGAWQPSRPPAPAD